MNTLLLALALVASPDINTAPAYCADPYAYRPWVRLEQTRELIAEIELAKLNQEVK